MGGGKRTIEEKKNKGADYNEMNVRVYLVVNADNFVALDRLNHHRNKQLDPYKMKDRI
jgi:hypothetical protein